MASVGSEGPAVDLAAVANHLAAPEPEMAAVEEQEEEDVVLAAAAPVNAEEEAVAPASKAASGAFAQVGGVLLGLCGLAALLAGAVLVSQAVAARSSGEAGSFSLPAFPAAVSRIWRRAEYETVAEEGAQDAVAGIRV